MKVKKHTKNAEETIALAKKIGQNVDTSFVILLEGDLGAGKTTFTKGLAEGLGITQLVKSPTFTIIREYTSGRLPLYHMDVYRLEEASPDELGFDEYFLGDGVSVVEWAHYIAETLPSEYLKITISRVSDDERNLEFEAVGMRYKAFLTEVLE
ncbi:tRNA (adenosine(37)-N6)-threonylcarbamoyltransferase complex ATPase subunit type 1 TsaE [Listeria goaensis]|uniref:tRNA (adenosine(37)-N6)-threonylcarbamoyltransferase complex ATPase subunit type 1 TsaE n=1 Tax=Listeria goaensis TaxID=1649188 RepID=UPI000B58E814|nr:tRNA (adenosine(37)-N6)-threonylcarbamoyltransferase complex ATPase subunit type 1 TsaE [Listeria goaensis]